MFRSICGPICKHFLFLSEFWIIFNFRGRFKQNKVANQQMHTNLPQIKSGKPKSIKKKHWNKKMKIALQKVQSNPFFHFFFKCLLIININWIKADELGINGPISWTHRTQNIRKNQNLYPQQSQITLFTLPWDTLYQIILDKNLCISMICNEVKATGGTKIGYYILFRKYKSEVDMKEAFVELRRSLLKKFLTEGFALSAKKYFDFIT